MTFDVKIGDTIYPLVRDVRHVHAPELHAHLGTTSEARLQRLLDAVEADDWFNADGTYIGRDPFGIGIAGQEPQVCPECGGRGTVLDAPDRVLDGHPYWVPCPACGGQS